MYNWIDQYLNNRKARVLVNGSYSRKKTIKEGVPQGGILSPSLFLIYISDIVKDLPNGVKVAIYADDIALWCSEENLTTARYRIQEALNVLNAWTKRWLMKINTNKTTYTIFSLSTKEQEIELRLDGQKLAEDKSPTYLGITFDKRLTWKHQIQTAEVKAKTRLALMRRLAGTSWGADLLTLKKVYTGYVRPAIEYGAATWCTSAKTHVDKLNKIQNQATRIMTGGMKSTPIQALEKTTCLQPLDDRINTKVLIQASKFKRLSSHPMKRRMDVPSKSRLQRSSFVPKSNQLRKQDRDLPHHIPQFVASPPWEDGKSKIFLEVPGVGPKESQDENTRRNITSEYIEYQFPKDQWTRVYTDGSSEEAVRNGGAGVYVQYPNGTEEKMCFPTGKYSTNYKAECLAIEKAATLMSRDITNSIKDVVILTDALSVLQALQKNTNPELNNLTSAISHACSSKNLTLQWIPSHCGLIGNETADKLAKDGAAQEQTDFSTSYSEEKTIIKSKSRESFQRKHPNLNKSDPFYHLSREEQVTIFRLRVNHNRLRHHLFTKLKIGDTDLCQCGIEAQTTTHILQTCPNLNEMRKKTWPTPTSKDQKLFGCLLDLQRTAAFIKDSGLSI